MELKKVKCKLCGKVGVRSMPKGLSRHLRLNHNIFTKSLDEYFEETSSDAIVELKPGTKKEFLKSIRPKRPKVKSTTTYSNTPARIIYTPMGNKR
jgi:hypothetical protein